MLELAQRLNAQYPTAICCLDVAGTWADRLTRIGIPVTAVGRTPGFHPGLGRRVAAVARAHRATVLHAHHYSPFIYSALARTVSPSLRVVFTEHGRLSDAPPSGKRRLANQLFGRLAHRVFAVSEDVKRHLVGEGFPAGRVGVIYNGIDVGPLPTSDARAAARARLGVSDTTFVIGTIARLDPVKDLGTLIRAVALVASSLDTVLVVVGDGPERAPLEGLAEASGVGGRVRFLGQRDDARAWLAGFDVYVNSSVSEGISLTILEAMAAGLPVIATRVGGTPEILDDQCGRLVPSGKAAELADQLRDLANNPDTRMRLGQAARRHVETRFTIDRMVGEYAAVYRSL